MARIYSKKIRAAEKSKTKAMAERHYLEEVYKKKCPGCGVKNTAFIIYGLPNFNDELNQDLKDGLIILGGCDLFESNRKFECNECGYSWS